MESYGRVNKIEKEYQKVQMADGYQSFDWVYAM
jgi:hypothetical protein